MKKLIVVLAVIFSSAGMAHDHRSAALEISSSLPGDYTVIINGRQFFSDGYLNLENLAPGNYHMKIIRRHRVGPRYYDHGAQLIFQGRLHLPQATLVQGYIDHLGVAFNNVPRFYSHGVHDYPVNRMREYAMLPDDFDRLLASLDRASFDKTRFEIAAVAVDNNLMSSRQIARVMRRFSFDHYRLDFAKLAYASCTDPENYYMLADGFTFTSNKHALLQFLR